jgi:DNA mismatch repair ATPase MutS
MIPDTQTLQDLELIRSRDGGPSVLVTLDRTSTRAGRLRLGEALGIPLQDARRIRRRQEAIRYLHVNRVRFTVAAASVEAAEAYLASSYATAASTGRLRRAGEATWIALRYRDLLRFAREGVAAVARLSTEVSHLLVRIGAAPQPPALRCICDEVAELVAGLNPAVLHAASSYRAALALDHRLRDVHRDELERLLALLAELDLLCGAARLLDEGWVLPAIKPGEAAHLEGSGLWHPFLPEGVRNPVSLRGGETLVFLTGPNMAGKTTWLRAVGICVWLAQCGLPVPAERLSFTPVERFYTGLSPEDNLREGLSYFLAEVRRVKEVIQAVAEGRRTIAIFDEVFRGTNVTDAMEASLAVLEGCSRASSSAFIFSSHLTELAEALRDLDTVKFCRFEGGLDGTELRFDYRLHAGVSAQRFGMELLRQEGLQDLLASIPPSVA